MQISAIFPFLVEAAIKGTLAIGVAWVVVRLLRKKSATIRYLVWTHAFAAVLILPALNVVLPELSIPVVSSPAAKDLIFRIELRESAVAGEVRGSTAKPEPRPSSMLDWRAGASALWAAGFLFSFAQISMGWLSMRRLKRTATPFAVRDSIAAHCLSETLVLKTDSGRMPMTHGIFRPIIFVPADAEDWDDDRLRMVMLHEFAHVQRADTAHQLLARVVLALFWWNPVIWHAWREFLKEREKAADDMVLMAGEDGAEYAGHLLEIARSFQEPSREAWAAVSMASKSQLEGRLISILDAKRDRKLPSAATARVSLAVALLLAGPLAALQGHSQEDQSQSNLPARVASLMQAGETALDAGKFDDAKAEYTRALDDQPNLAIALIHRGIAELALKDYPAATEDFERVPTSDLTNARMSLLWQAIAQERQDNVSAAARLYQQAIAVGDVRTVDTIVAMDLYSGILRQQGRAEEAAALQEQVSEAKGAMAKEIGEQHPLDVKVFHAGKDVQPPVLLSKVEPDYSGMARIAKYQGTTVLRVEVGANGKTHDVYALRPLGLGLDEKAIQAVNKWSFQPGIKDGEPVAVAATIEVQFRLK